MANEQSTSRAVSCQPTNCRDPSSASRYTRANREPAACSPSAAPASTPSHRLGLDAATMGPASEHREDQGDGEEVMRNASDTSSRSPGGHRDDCDRGRCREGRSGEGNVVARHPDGEQQSEPENRQPIRGAQLGQGRTRNKQRSRALLAHHVSGRRATPSSIGVRRTGLPFASCRGHAVRDERRASRLRPRRVAREVLTGSSRDHGL